MPRIAPAEPPYEPEIASALARIMPEGVPPLLLFRTMARNPRVFHRLFAGGLLDRGSLTLRQREIVIDRTTARLDCAYEWGVHIAFFAEKAGFTDAQVAATATGGSDADCWSEAEQTLLAAVDDLVDHRTIGEAVWTRLAKHFDEQQILETIALVGYYHTISFLCRALALRAESYTVPFPSIRPQPWPAAR